MYTFLKKELIKTKQVPNTQAEVLVEELGIETLQDSLNYYPFKYEDRTKIYKIVDLNPSMETVPIKITITTMRLVSSANSMRFVVTGGDETGDIELVWFSNFKWIQKILKQNTKCIVLGKPIFYREKISMSHPSIKTDIQMEATLYPVYTVTHIMKKRYLTSNVLAKLQKKLLKEKAVENYPENLSDKILTKHHLVPKRIALQNIHFPKNKGELKEARLRLKFEELFYLQWHLLKNKKSDIATSGKIFRKYDWVRSYYENKLPFQLTNAQKRVMQEIKKDFASGKQMNRLLQGDVGSGKTIIAFLSMLIAVENQTQVAIMTPTEILTEQHYREFRKLLVDEKNIQCACLTGSLKKKAKEEIYAQLAEHNIHLIIGTHALIQEGVKFANLGLVIIDEQHRFGVAQRSELWTKNIDTPPHVLVMTATPIPRTLAMTLYGDLNISTIDELPQGRKQIKTLHFYEKALLKVLKFILLELKAGRQAYIVYPLIEASKKLDYQNLIKGYEQISEAFPNQKIDMLHGQMASYEKEEAMEKFVKGETNILVATTVIEVGIHVENATIMVIQNAERFGLSQLHQLRGRVGRSDLQSYCILMTDYKLTKEAKKRMKTMISTTDGFQIANVDLELRGPGYIMGLKQSGGIQLKIADLNQDTNILQQTNREVRRILQEDPDLKQQENTNMKHYLDFMKTYQQDWSNIS